MTPLPFIATSGPSSLVPPTEVWHAMTSRSAAIVSALLAAIPFGTSTTLSFVLRKIPMFGLR